ncbi:MAG: response regulator transcription factor, partial [Firmicutes bacterium]|nr:response regulator transcription factor [Bacillota bacterium]
LLDVMLPGIDGRELLDYCRLCGIPAIFLTALGDLDSRVRGLRAGAEDYISKPFGIMDFVARVKAFLRRTGSVDLEMGEELICGKIRLDENRHKVFSGMETVELTYKEFELLKYLMRHQDQVMSRQQIMDAVWDTDFCGESRTVDMHVKTLRQKLGEQGNCIKTVRNIGYKLEHQE